MLAPDWIWQGEALSILLVLRAREDATADVVLEVEVQGGEAFAAPAEDARRRSIRVPPGETVRASLRGWRARHEVPAGLHPDAFRVRLRTAGAERVLNVACRTARGPAVPRGWWSIVVPALLSLAALPAFWVLLRAYARPGAWRTVRNPTIPPPEDRWWSEP